MVADIVPHCDLIADVGCDHGYLSIYLLENSIADYVYAMDVNPGPLSRAKANIEKYGYSQSIETILSDGLKALSGRPIPQACLICGMGGPLGLRLLYDSRELVANMNRVFVQLQSDIPLVRYQLKEWGFTILNESMCFDEGKYYFVIEAQPSASFADAFVGEYNPDKTTSWDDYCNKKKEAFDTMSADELSRYVYSDLVYDNEPEVYAEYVQTEIARMIKVRRALEDNDGSTKAQSKLASLNKEIDIYESKQSKRNT